MQRDPDDTRLTETNYEHLCDTVTRWITAPHEPGQVAIIQERLAHQAFSSEIRKLARTFCSAQPLRTLRRYLMEFELLPEDIFDFLDMRRALATSGLTADRCISLLSLSAQNPIHQTFMEEYFGWRASALHSSAEQAMPAA
jgi:hypothetical protein